MLVIVGLGNPDDKYQGTRHNVGFDVIDLLAEKYNIAVDTKKHRAYIGKGKHREQRPFPYRLAQHDLPAPEGG